MRLYHLVVRYHIAMSLLANEIIFTPLIVQNGKPKLSHNMGRQKIMRCTECNKVFRGGKGWKISRGFYSMYATCPKHSKDNPQEKTYEDLRIQRS